MTKFYPSTNNSKLRSNQIFKAGILILTFAMCASFLFITPAQAKDGYPNLANYYLKTPVTHSEIEQLSKWDVVILGMQIQDTNPEIFGILKQRNPDIKIIAYLSAMEFPKNLYHVLESNNGPWHKMYQQINPAWWLKDGSGNPHSIWPGNDSFNITDYCPTVGGEKFYNFLARFVDETLMSTGNWDGVFYDNVLDGIKFTNDGHVDINNDGQVDEKNWADEEWRKGMQKLLSETRNRLGSDKIVMVNSSSYGKANLNGRLYETWPDKWQGGWIGQMNDYSNLENSITFSPQIIVLNPNTDNTGNASDYKKVRFGITSTLMGDGYFAFDYGTQDHSQTWWYDEYDVNLGQPIDSAKNLLSNNSSSYQTSVWQRDYTKGIALVNSTNQTQTIKLDQVFEKIRGSQDTYVNNGELVREVTLPAQDGLILLRKIELTTPVIKTQPKTVPDATPDTNTETDTSVQSDPIPSTTGEKINVTGTTFTNGAYIRIFNKRGHNIRAGFYAYDSSFEAGAEIIVADLDLNGSLETVVAGKKDIKIFDVNKNLINSFYPYGSNYNSGINVDVGNVQGSKNLEIVTGTKNGGSPHVKIFDYQGHQLNDGFFAYDENFRGGVQIALGDLNGNGYKEIVTGAGFGGGPHVRIFDYTGHLFDPGFFPYDKNFRGGVNVDCGDLNGDGKDEIITGAGKTGGPHVRIYDKIGHLVDPGFFAFDVSDSAGVRVGVTDINNDGEVEILGMH